MDEILNLIESVSEGFPSYFFIILQNLHVFRQISSTGDLLLPKIDLIFGVKLVFYFA